MNASILTATTAALAMSIAGSASAAFDIHITGTDWGIWGSNVNLPDIFPVQGDPDANRYDFADGGSGIPMDFMMTLTDGTDIDGADLDMRMISTTLRGHAGDASLELLNWSVWVTAEDIGSLHVVWNSGADALTLDNLGSSGKDGVRYAGGGFDQSLAWTLERADGSVETFTTNFDSFEVTLPVPAPGAAALFGLAGLTASRRRRG